MNLVCGNANPTPYAEWPDPAAATGHAEADAGRARARRAGLQRAAGGGNETLTDNATITATTSMNAASSGTRLVYQTTALTRRCGSAARRG